MTWTERNPTRWEAEMRIGSEILEGLDSGVTNGTAYLQGVFHVRSQHGHTYESVKLRIEYPDLFPKRGSIPKVSLVSHRDRWVRGGDSHINSDWSLCLFVPCECGIDIGKEDSLNSLFATVHTFLFKEHVYQRALLRQEVTGEKAIWPGEARSHGLAGVVEAVRESGAVRRNDPCPCGSGRKYKACCIHWLKSDK